MTVSLLFVVGSFMALILGRAGQDTIWQLSFWFLGVAIWTELYKMNRRREKDDGKEKAQEDQGG